MKKIFTLFLLLAASAFVNQLIAQKVFRTTGSGAWNSYTIWEVSTTGTGGPFSAAPSGTAGGTNFPDKTCDVIIQTGHTVTLGATYTVKNLTINTGGTLQSDGSARTFRPYGDAANPVTITNNGTLGGATTGPDAIALEAYAGDAASFGFTLTGTGTTRINRIRMAGGALNAAHTLTVVIDQDVTLTQSNNYALSAVYNPTTADVYTLTINAGKTVTLAGTGSYFHSSSVGSGTGFGSYTYNINGTLDATANTNATYSTTFQPLGNSSTLALNISGTYKIGIFNTSTNGGATGTLTNTIKNGGTVDATAATTFTATDYPFQIEGTGKITRTVAAADAVFPVAVAGSNNPVTLNNSGTSDVFAVAVTNTVSNTSAIPNATKIVNRQWSITETTPGGTNTSLKLAWLTADQAAGFNPANPVVIARWNGTGWQYFAATVTGTGVNSDPYVATATGFTQNFTASNPFIVANTTALPVSFYGLKAFSKEKGVQVEWLVSTEVNTSNYVIERSANGKDFSAVSNVNATGNTSYSVFDATPIAGVNYYRIRATDKDASVKLSSVVAVNINKDKAEIVIAPNPVKSNFNLQFAGLEKGNYTVKLVNSVGQVVLSQQVNIDAASLSKSFSLPSGLKSGIYTIQIVGTDFNTTKRIVVE